MSQNKFSPILLYPSLLQAGIDIVKSATFLTKLKRIAEISLSPFRIGSGDREISAYHLFVVHGPNFCKGMAHNRGNGV